MVHVLFKMLKSVLILVEYQYIKILDEYINLNSDLLRRENIHKILVLSILNFYKMTDCTI